MVQQLLDDLNNTELTSTDIAKHDSYDEVMMKDDSSYGEEFVTNIDVDDRFDDNDASYREKNDDDNNERINLQSQTINKVKDNQDSDEKMRQNNIIRRRDEYAERARRRNSCKALIAQLELLRPVEKDPEENCANEVIRGRNRDPIPHTHSLRLREASPSITRLYNNGVTKLRAEYAQSLERRKDSTAREDNQCELERLQRLVAINKDTYSPKAERLYTRGVEKLRHQLASIERSKLNDELEAKKKDAKMQKLIVQPVPLSQRTENMYINAVAKLRAQSVERSKPTKDSESQDVKLHKLAAGAKATAGVDNLYNRGVAKLRAKSTEHTTRLNDESNPLKQLQTLKKLVSKVQALPAADKLYQHGFIKLRTQSVERIRAIHSNSPQSKLPPQVFQNAGPNAERMYNLGVSKLRAQSAERQRFIEAHDATKQLEKLNKLVSNNTTVSQNTENLYHKGVSTIRANMERHKANVNQYDPITELSKLRERAEKAKKMSFTDRLYSN